MLDCPGIVPPTTKDFQSDCAKLLKGVVRAERVDNPSDFMDEVLARVKKCYLCQRYKLDADTTTWTDGEDFLNVLANKMGKLKKGGEADIETAARIVIYDWQRGRIPFFTMPPENRDAPLVNGASASSSSSTSAPKSTPPAEEHAAIADSASAPEEDATSGRETLQVRQSLSELACSVAFDEEDRRGDPLPEEKNDTADKAEATEAKAKVKRKKRTSKEAGLPKDDNAPEEAHGAVSSAYNTKKKKLKKRRRTGGSSRTGDGMAVREGTMDWKAAVAEFDM
jgi:nuclear GTP-binding protein